MDKTPTTSASAPVHEPDSTATRAADASPTSARDGELGPHSSSGTDHAPPPAAEGGAATVTWPAPWPEAAVATDVLLDRLRRAVGAERVLDDAETLQRLSRDCLQPSRATSAAVSPPALPVAVVRPRDTEDVARVVRIAAAAGVPIVELGGGTGLMGGARSIGPGIVLDMRGMNHVLAISAEDRTAHVEAGVVLADLATALAPHDLVVGHDPWTFPIATVGGTLSANGLGYTGGRYGSMGEQVLGLTAVLADGSIVSTRPAPRSSTGPRLRALFAGAEGTLGVVTDAVLRVYPRPEAEKLDGYTFAGFDDGFRAIQALFAAGVTPAVLDFGQTSAADRANGVLTAPTDEPGLLYLGFYGLKEEVRALRKRGRSLLTAHGGVRLPRDRARRFWRDRHVVAEQIRARQSAQDLAPDWLPAGVLFDFIHVCLPPSAVLAFKRTVEPLLLGHSISIGEWGLWNSPELFSVTMFKHVAHDGEREAFAAGVDAVLRLAQDMGGSMEYCHGAGVRLAHLMEREHGAAMTLLRGVKRTLDPHGLLNPGKLGL